MTKKVLYEKLTEFGYFNLREVPGRGLCGLHEFLFTIGLIENLDEIGYSGRYCYDKVDAQQALDALNKWDGKEDPKGNWIKYKGEKGEYNNPNYKNESSNH